MKDISFEMQTKITSLQLIIPNYNISAVLDPCNPVAQQNNTYLQSPGYPNGVSSASSCSTSSGRSMSRQARDTTTAYKYYIQKAASDVSYLYVLNLYNI